MVIFYETKNFIVEAHDNPHITRTDGGHIKITPKKPVENRWQLKSREATKLMKLSMLIGEAMKKALNKRGIPVERINFQENGNWPLKKNKTLPLHLHLYGRAKNSKYQKRGEALYFPTESSKYYKKLKPLNKEDIKEILKQIKIISKRRD